MMRGHKAQIDLSRVSGTLRAGTKEKTAGAEETHVQHIAARLPVAILVCPSGRDGGVLETALDLSGFIIVPAYSFADAKRCLASRPEAELVVCPCHIGRAPWTGLKTVLPPLCRVVLTLPSTDRVCPVADEVVFSQIRQPCLPENLRILVCLLSEARKRIAEKKQQEFASVQSARRPRDSEIRVASAQQKSVTVSGLVVAGYFAAIQFGAN